jgi:hypothetical protein
LNRARKVEGMSNHDKISEYACSMWVRRDVPSWEQMSHPSRDLRSLRSWSWPRLLWLTPVPLGNIGKDMNRVVKDLQGDFFRDLATGISTLGGSGLKTRATVYVQQNLDKARQIKQISSCGGNGTPQLLS